MVTRELSDSQEGSMSAKATKISPEQLKRRQAFERLKRSLRHSTPSPLAQPSPPTMPAETSAATDDAPAPPELQTPPPDPPRPATAPANHGVAFAVREPMTCEICQRPATKWLSYKPEAKTCICWDCGIERQKRMMRGEKG